MDITTIAGVAVFGLLFGMALTNASIGLAQIWDLSSFLIVVGGSFAFALIGNPVARLPLLIGVYKQAFFARQPDPTTLIAELVRLAESARREGILALERDADVAADGFLAQGLRLAVDGVDPDAVLEIMQTERDHVAQRHQLGRAIVENMSEAAPALGLVGTLVGLIAMLSKLDDPAGIGPGMALALKTTLYGAVFGLAILKPIALKLRVRSEDELLIKDLVIEGILNIQAGENPRILRNRLLAHLAEREREEAPPEESRPGRATT